MTDYTREQQIADIKAAFDYPAEVIFSDDELIIVISSGKLYISYIGSDDDEMLFFPVSLVTDQAITVPMTVG